MFETDEIRIPADRVLSLDWAGGTLIDWASGGNRYHLDGGFEPKPVRASFPFDSAVVSPSGEYAAIFQNQGTKGLLLLNGEEVREINRSYYYAQAYEYPICLFRINNEQEMIAHCPDEYNRLEIDDLATGKRLTSKEGRSPSDFFFSRIAANDSGTFLISAGWQWHPIDALKGFSVQEALEDPFHLDGEGLLPDVWAEEISACFVSNDRIAVFMQKEQDQYKKEENLRLINLHKREVTATIMPESTVGTMMPIKEQYILGFHEHPKLFDLRTGKVVQRWPHVNSGTQTSSIIHSIEAVPPMAFDVPNMRFAVANETEIIVVQLHIESL